MRPRAGALRPAIFIFILNSFSEEQSVLVGLNSSSSVFCVHCWGWSVNQSDFTWHTPAPSLFPSMPQGTQIALPAFSCRGAACLPAARLELGMLQRGLGKQPDVCSSVILWRTGHSGLNRVWPQGRVHRLYLFCPHPLGCAASLEGALGWILEL